MVEITLHALLYGWNYPAHPSVRLKLSSTPFCMVEITQHTPCTVEITQHALLYGWNYPARPSVWFNLPNTPFVWLKLPSTPPVWLKLPSTPPVWLKLSSTPFSMVEITQYTLQYGWNYPARPERAEALSPGRCPGYKAISNAPCKGKSFKIHLIKIENPLRYVKLLPLQVVSCISLIPRALPWAKSFCPFRACCCGLLDL